jgi:hypothetical protein
MSHLFTFELAAGLASGRCPLCYAVASDVRRWLDSFWREGRQSPEARRRFYAGGGFCRRHAWLLHELVAAHSGAAIADLYGRLAEHDLATLRALLAKNDRRRRPGWRRLQRSDPCSACVEEAAALERKAEFFLEMIASESGRRRYERARGVCYPHLLRLLEAAENDEPLRHFLLGDWRRRLDEIRFRLDRFDRTRDHHFAAERREEDERSWTDVIHHYVGAPDSS